MTDPLDRLEAELAQLRPRPIPQRAVDGVERSLAIPESLHKSWPDRILLVAMSAGGLAASVIIGVLLLEITATPMLQPNPAPLMAATPRMGDAPLAFAFATANDQTR